MKVGEAVGVGVGVSVDEEEGTQMDESLAVDGCEGVTLDEVSIGMVDSVGVEVGVAVECRCRSGVTVGEGVG